MSRLFEPIVFDNSNTAWVYRSTSTKDFHGYYHWHQCCEVLIVHDGEGTVVMNGNTYPIQRGMIFVFRPYQLHHIHVDVKEGSPYIRTIMFFNIQEVERHLHAFPKRYSIFSAICTDEFSFGAYNLLSEIEELEETLNLYHKQKKQGTYEDTEGFTLMFLSFLSTFTKLDKNLLFSKPYKIDRTINLHSQIIMKWIDSNFQDNITLDLLSENLHLSKFYMSRLFRHETGSSIVDYLTATRLKQACKLLETTSLSVEQVGIHVGYQISSYFIYLFKKVMRITPLQYRKRIKKSHIT